MNNPFNFSYNTYRDQFAPLPVDQLATAVQGLNEMYVQGVSQVDSLKDQLLSINVSQEDEPEKSRIVDQALQSIEQFSTNGNFEDAPIAALKIARGIKDNEWLNVAMKRYAKMQEEDKLAREYDVSDAQLWGRRMHRQKYGATPTQRNKFGQYDEYVPFDVFKEPDYYSELTTQMNRLKGQYDRQVIAEDGSVRYIQGNNEVTEEQLKQEAHNYIMANPKMQKLLGWEADMRYSTMDPVSRETEIATTLANAKSELDKQVEYLKLNGGTEEDINTVLENQAAYEELASTLSTTEGQEEFLRRNILQNVIDTKFGGLAKSRARSESTIRGVNWGSGSGSGGTYSGNTRGGSITSKAVNPLNNVSAQDKKAMKGPEGEDIAKREVEIEGYISNIGSSDEYKDLREDLASKGIQVVAPGKGVTAADIKNQIRNNNQMVSSSFVEIDEKLGDAMFAQQEIKTSQGTIPIAGSNQFVLLADESSGGGSYNDIGSFEELTRVVGRELGGRKTSDVEITWKRIGISPVNPYGLPGGIVYVMNASNKVSGETRQFQVMKSNSNLDMQKYFKGLEPLSQFMYSGDIDYRSGKDKNKAVLGADVINVPIYSEGVEGAIAGTFIKTKEGWVSAEQFAKDYTEGIFDRYASDSRSRTKFK